MHTHIKKLCKTIFSLKHKVTMLKNYHISSDEYTQIIIGISSIDYTSKLLNPPELVVYSRDTNIFIIECCEIIH